MISELYVGIGTFSVELGTSQSSSPRLTTRDLGILVRNSSVRAFRPVSVPGLSLFRNPFRYHPEDGPKI